MFFKLTGDKGHRSTGNVTHFSKGLFAKKGKGNKKRHGMVNFREQVHPLFWLDADIWRSQWKLSVSAGPDGGQTRTDTRLSTPLTYAAVWQSCQHEETNKERLAGPDPSTMLWGRKQSTAGHMLTCCTWTREHEHTGDSVLADQL